jgi:hypothetical protein
MATDAGLPVAAAEIRDVVVSVVVVDVMGLQRHS